MTKIEALQWLHEMLKPGDKVFAVLRHVSRSGMYRRISLFAVRDGSMICLDRAAIAAGVGNNPRGGGDGIGVGGCGMDMGFALVTNLSSAMYPGGFGCCGNACRSNDHLNGDRDYTPHPKAQAIQAVARRIPGQVSDPATEPGHWHRQGGYAFNYQWV